MRIAFPVEEDIGKDSRLHHHFGTADCFVIADTDTDTLLTISNDDLEHAHGDCQPVRTVSSQEVGAVVVGGIGKGALQKLLDSDIKVFRGVEGTVEENLELARDNRLPQFMFNMTCSGHGTGGNCTH